MSIGRAVGAARHGIDDEDRDETERKGEPDEQDRAQAQHDGEGAPEGGARRDADDLRADEGVAEDRLQRGSADGQAAADQHGEQDAREADEQDDVARRLLGRGGPGQLRPEDLEDLRDRDGEPPDAPAPRSR